MRCSMGAWMKILIDTHIFLWLANDSLGKMNKYKLAEVYNTNNTVYISSLSIAEIMIKVSIGKMEFSHDILAVLEDMDIAVLDFDAKSALLLASLPFHHRDPFDRMIISQAITKKLTIFSVDKKFKLYECELL